MVFHWSLSDTKSPQVSRTRLRILAALSNAVVWIIIIIIIIIVVVVVVVVAVVVVVVVVVPSSLFRRVSGDSVKRKEKDRIDK